jgi:hypothetical protein
LRKEPKPRLTSGARPSGTGFALGSESQVRRVIVLAWGYLSCLLWQLGYTQQAEAAGRQSVQKAREIGQPSRLAFALHSEMLRRGLFEADPKSALPLADEIVACGKQDGVQLYPAWARFYQGVVAAQDADPRPGIAVMRQVRQGLQRNKVGLFGPIHLYHLAMAHSAVASTTSPLDCLRKASGLSRPPGSVCLKPSFIGCSVN